MYEFVEIRIIVKSNSSSLDFILDSISLKLSSIFHTNIIFISGVGSLRFGLVKDVNLIVFQADHWYSNN